LNARLALLATLSLLSACTGRSHAQDEGCYTITPVRPSGIIRDDCRLLRDAAYNLNTSFSFFGDYVELNFRLGSPAFGVLLDVSMAGHFKFGEEQFGADGTAANVLLPIEGQDCSVERVAIHMDAATNPDNPRVFTGLLAITTFTAGAEQCVCTAWFNYQADLSSDPKTCS
jgi:hypothetical protein